MKNTNDLRLATTNTDTDGRACRAAFAAFLDAATAAESLDLRDAACGAFGRCERCGDMSPTRTVCGGCREAAEMEGVEETPPGQAR